MHSVKTYTVASKEFVFIEVNKPEMDVTFMNYGATIMSIFVPDQNGVKENVLLAYNNLSDYIKNKRHLNATIGPTAGRIKDATFQIDDTIVTLEKNFMDKHNLHGGEDALSYTFFEYEIEEKEDETIVAFFTTIKSGEQHYLGTQEYKIVYHVKASRLEIEFFATTTTPTLVNLTNHAYFNLSGNLRSNILQHEMQINAENVMALTDEMIPYAVQSLHGTSLDYRAMRPIWRDDFTGVDDPYILNHIGLNKPSATLVDPTSKRQLDVYTDYPCIVCYTDNFPMTYDLLYDAPNELHMGVCFEAQNPPNGIHVDNVEKSILRPKETYHHKTIFAFSLKE